MPPQTSNASATPGDPFGGGGSAAPTNVRAAVVARMEQVELLPRPINPAWVIEGNPQARAGKHSGGADGWGSTSHWDCTAGRFRWHYGWEETVFILEGEVRVTDADGHTSVLRVGDVALFPGGSHFVWEVPVYVRKLAFLRRPVPRYTQRLFDLRNDLSALKKRLVRRLRGVR